MEDYIKSLKVGNINLKNNVFLAPMAGVTDIPFRKVVRDIRKTFSYFHRNG